MYQDLIKNKSLTKEKLLTLIELQFDLFTQCTKLEKEFADAGIGIQVNCDVEYKSFDKGKTNV